MGKKKGRSFARRKPHLWREVPIRVPARVGGVDGYRFMERCPCCKRSRRGRFVRIEAAIV